MQKKLNISNYILNITTLYGRLDITYNGKKVYNGVPFNDFYDIKDIRVEKDGLLVDGLVKRTKILNSRDRRHSLVLETKKMRWDLLDLTVFEEPKIKKQQIETNQKHEQDKIDQEEEKEKDEMDQEN